MTNDECKSSLNFTLLSDMILSLHQNSKYKLFDENGLFFKNKLVMEIEGYKVVDEKKIIDNVVIINERVIEYADTITIHPNNIFNIHFIAFPVEDLKILNYENSRFFTDTLSMKTDNGKFIFENNENKSEMEQCIEKLFNIKLKTLNFCKLNCKFLQVDETPNKPIELQWT